MKRIPQIVLAAVLCTGAVAVALAAFLQRPGEKPYAVIEKEAFAAQPDLKLETAISEAILEKAKDLCYYPGSIPTEGHKVLRAEFYNGFVKVYCITDYASYSFERDMAIRQSAASCPSVITFADDGMYHLAEYREPRDGVYYGRSLQKMFPDDLRLLLSEAYVDQSENLYVQHEQYINDYLKRHGKGNVTIRHRSKLFYKGRTVNDFIRQNHP